MTTNELVVLDTSPYESRSEADKQLVVLRNRDANARFKSPVLKQLKNFCHKKILIFHVKILIFKKNKLRKEKGLPMLTLGSTELEELLWNQKEQFKEQLFKFQQQVIIRLKKLLL